MSCCFSSSPPSPASEPRKPWLSNWIPNEARFRMAKRAYVVIDKQGIIRYMHTMEEARHLLDADEIFNTVKTIVTAAQ